MRFPERPTVYLDVSLMMGNRLNTGIQRVVRNLSQVGPEVCAEFRYNCRLVQCIDGQFYRLRYNLIDRESTDWVSQVVRRRLGRQLMGQAIPRFSSPLRPLAIDRVVTLNGTWDQPDWLPGIAQLCRQCHVSSVIHDLIPLTHPQFHTAELNRRFSSWFEGLASTVPNLMATSSHGRHVLESRLAEMELAQVPRVSQFRLSSGLVRNDRPGLAVIQEDGKRVLAIRPQLAALLQSGPVLLAVGTIEPRKNHQQLLHACDVLWKQGWTGKLLIMGARGWHCESTLQRIAELCQEDPSRCLYLSDGTDQELAYAYRHASSLVFASWTEGFGLPIVEALEHGLPVLLSDTEIHREVGGSAADYFELGNVDSLVARLAKHHRDGFEQLRQAAGRFRPVSTEESFRTLLCDAIVAGRQFRAEIQNTPAWEKPLRAG